MSRFKGDVLVDHMDLGDDGTIKLHLADDPKGQIGGADGAEVAKRILDLLNPHCGCYFPAKCRFCGGEGESQWSK